MQQGYISTSRKDSKATLNRSHSVVYSFRRSLNKKVAGHSGASDQAGPVEAEVQSVETAGHSTTGDVHIDVAEDADPNQDDDHTAVPIDDPAATVKTQSGKHSVFTTDLTVTVTASTIPYRLHSLDYATPTDHFDTSDHCSTLDLRLHSQQAARVLVMFFLMGAQVTWEQLLKALTQR